MKKTAETRYSQTLNADAELLDELVLELNVVDAGPDELEDLSNFDATSLMSNLETPDIHK